MEVNLKIDSTIVKDVQEHLAQIEKEHEVVILQAVESGSRAWGFPSPDSDYDVRFIYAHLKDWYIQLSEERDVIELPVNDELDIAGWDLRKALNLANSGNAVVQEWMISPIVYRQSASFVSLAGLIDKAFNPIASYHHYRSMAKKAYAELEQVDQKVLKRFFYFARATLSAKWILEKLTMPSIVFSDLVNEVVSDESLAQKISQLVNQKAKELERSTLKVPLEVYTAFTLIFESLEEDINIDSGSKILISNKDFQKFLNEVSLK